MAQIKPILDINIQKNCSSPKSGGNPSELTKDALEKIWDEKAILWPHEYTDPKDQIYNVNIQYDPFIDNIKFEIVGEGYGLADLNRGHINPHQTITVKKSFG